MSLFGFGRKRDDDKIPLSSSHHEESSTGTQSAPPIVTSPQGAPPTQVNFMPSPALSSPDTSSKPNKHEIAASNLSIPNIHVFNPADSQHQTVDHLGSAHEDQQYYEYHQQKGKVEGETVNLQPSVDAYDEAADTAEQNYVEDHAYYESYYGSTNDANYGEDQLQQHYQQETDIGDIQYDTNPSYDDENQEFATAYTSISGSMDTVEEPRLVPSNDDEEEFYWETDMNQSPYPSSSYEENEPTGAAPTAGMYEPEPLPEPVETPNQLQYQYQDRREASPPLRDTIDGIWDEVRMEPMPQPTTPSQVRRSILSRLRTPSNREMEEYERKEESPKTAEEEIFTPEFKEVHQKNVRRRMKFQQNMQDLERRLAKLTNKLANLIMDREAQECCFMRDNVCTPMQQAAERVALEKEYLTSPQHTGEKHWMAFTTRLSRIETEMTKYVHGTLQDALQEKIGRLHDELIHEDVPQNHLDTYRSEKREESMLRQFEELAAISRRRYHEERAARCGAFEVVRQQLLTVAKLETDPARIEDAIAKVKALRAKLEQERAERRMRDENLLVAIEEDRINMNRALWEVTEGADASAPRDDSVRRAIEYH